MKQNAVPFGWKRECTDWGVLPLWGRGTALVAVEGFEAVRPNAFHTCCTGYILQLEVSAIADNPTTIVLTHNGPPPPLGADLLLS